MAKLITQRDLIRTVAQRWRELWPSSRDYEKAGWCESTIGEISRKLLALDVETATQADVDGIIGNSSWVTMYCDECGSQCTDVIQLGHEPDYGSSTANLCRSCFEEAMTLWCEPGESYVKVDIGDLRLE